MRLSLKTKVAIFVTAIIVIISLVIAYLFISSHRHYMEREIISRGKTLSHALARTAEEGLVSENLDILKRASYIIQAEDVALTQVYSTLWEAVDAHPFEMLKEQPHPEAVRHFKTFADPMYKKIGSDYDFYSPILFSPSMDSQPITIGFARLILSSEQIEGEIKKAVVDNIIASLIITLLSLIAVNIIISRIVVNPVLRVYKSMKMFKNGTTPDIIPIASKDEIGALSEEFNQMSRAIKEKHEKLIESEIKIKSLFERTEHALFQLDKDCNIIQSNRKFKEMFGNAVKLCDIYIAESDIRDCVQRAVSEENIQAEENVVDKNGNILTILLSLYPDFNTDGNIKNIDGYIIDITEKKRLEQSLIHAQKMEAIGMLAGGLAHDFNNMLQGIIGYASFLKMKVSDTDQMYKPLSVIENSANRAADLTKQLLGYAGGGKYVVKAINLNTAVENVYNLISRTFDKAIEIKTFLSDNLWTFEGDESQLEHVIMNLCINARDAMPIGGILQLETMNKEFRTGETMYPWLKEGRYVCIKISDTGVGIDKEILDRIFEPLFTTKKMGKGTGLGLAMVYGVIKNHGGYITVESEPGKGTAFTIYLPALITIEGEKN